MKCRDCGVTRTPENTCVRKDGRMNYLCNSCAARKNYKKTIMYYSDAELDHFISKYSRLRQALINERRARNE
jgi:hypothetical protein